MRRRELITLLGGATIWPRLASAQQPARMPHVVLLSPAGTPAQADGTRRLLSELGYVEGRNIRLDFRTAAGNADALPALAQELVQEGGVDVIVAISTPAALAAHQATQTIPIVAFTAVDPVASGLANSLPPPAPNITGIPAFSNKTTTNRSHSIL